MISIAVLLHADVVTPLRDQGQGCDKQLIMDVCLMQASRNARQLCRKNWVWQSTRASLSWASLAGLTTRKGQTWFWMHSRTLLAAIARHANTQKPVAFQPHLRISGAWGDVEDRVYSAADLTPIFPPGRHKAEDRCICREIQLSHSGKFI